MKQSKKHQQDVIDYYDSTKREYKIIWKNKDNLGIHFGYYDDDNKDHNSAILNINRKIAEIASITAKDKVLDAGCGVGGTAIWLAENINCYSVGVTIVPWQYEKGQDLIIQKQLSDKVKIIIGDYADTGLDSNSFTVVIGLESIVHAEDKLTVVREAYRLLKPGGRLVVCEYMLTNDRMSMFDTNLIKEWLDGWSMPSLLSQKQYEDIAKRAKFKKIIFKDWTEQTRPSFDRLNKFIKILMPLHKPLRAFHIVNKGQIENLKASNAQMKSLEKGLWRYKVMVATK
jgi:tocopherol O-methyltransferase